MRLSQEAHSVLIISRQAQCLLACINCLHLVSSKYRWIVRPMIDQGFPEGKNPKKKRSIEGQEILHYKVKKQVEVLELNDIKKEYYLAEARSKLAKMNSEVHLVAQSGEIFILLSLFTFCLRFGFYKLAN